MLKSTTGTLSIFLTACLFLAQASVLFADDSLISQGDFIQEASVIKNKPTVNEIETAIAEISAPIDGEKISWIQNAIMDQDLKEKERLRKALDKRLDEVFALKEQNFESMSFAKLEEKTSAPREVSAQGLHGEIDGLNLSKDATVEDLRKRDELVGIIANVDDPTLRYELLQHLKTKEDSAK
jgi:hypothetical protein